MAKVPPGDPRFDEIEGHRPYLVRYALAQLRDAELAQEVVQEPLLERRLGIAPGLRRLPPVPGLVEDLVEPSFVAGVLAGVGGRQAPPVARKAAPGIDHLEAKDRREPRPEARPGVESRQRLERGEQRLLDRLPAMGGRIFFKREVLGEETRTICGTEGITESNCWVILHRSRLALRACFEANWFGKEAARGG